MLNCNATASRILKFVELARPVIFRYALPQRRGATKGFRNKGRAVSSMFNKVPGGHVVISMFSTVVSKLSAMPSAACLLKPLGGHAVISMLRNVRIMTRAA